MAPDQSEAQDFETATTVDELQEILEAYSDDTHVVVEDRHGVACNVEVADETLASGRLVIRAGLPVDA